MLAFRLFRYPKWYVFQNPSVLHAYSAFISEFYARRLARILPALVFVLVVSATAANLFIPTAWLSGLSESTALYAFFGLSNWVMQNNSDNYFAPRAELNPYTHTWSLGVEEQFYVLAPLLVYLWLRAVRNKGSKGQKLAVLNLMIIAVASLLAAVWASADHPTVAFYFIGCRLWELAAGALLFLTTCQYSKNDNLPARSSAMPQITAWTGLALNIIAFIFASASHFPWPWALLPTIGTMLMVGGARTLPTDDIVRRVLSLKPMVWIGKRSYSLYLWHWPVYVIMRWTVGLHSAWLYITAVFLTFTLAVFSYRCIEQPLRHNAWIESRPKWFRLLFFLLLPILGFYFAQYLFNHKRIYTLSTVSSNKTDWYALAQMPYPDFGKRQCKVLVEYHRLGAGHEVRYVPTECRIPLSTRRVFILGDSHAGVYSPMFELLSAEEGMVVSLYSQAGCSYIDFKTPMEKKHLAPGCLEFSSISLNKVIAESSPGDVVFLPSLRMQRYGDQWASFNVPDMYNLMYNSEALKLRAEAIEDAKKWIKPLNDKQLKIVFAAPPPIFKAPPFRCSDWFNRDNPICIKNNQQSRAELETLRKPVIDGMNILSNEFSMVRIWDPFPLLCPGEICLPGQDNRPLFFDGDHVSAYSNMLLYPYFKHDLLGK